MKAIARLLAKPKDFTWDSLEQSCCLLVMKKKKGNGSRRMFIHGKTRHTISLHEPNPKPAKAHLINEIVDSLKEQGLI